MLKLKETRKEKGYTQQQLADLLNVTRATYSRYESGKISIDPDSLKKIADYLNVSVDHLLDHDIVKSPKTESIKLTKRDQGNLDKLLQQAEVTFDSDTYKLTDDDRAKIRSALELAFFDAKKRNKRKKD